MDAGRGRLIPRYPLENMRPGKRLVGALTAPNVCVCLKAIAVHIGELF